MILFMFSEVLHRDKVLDLERPAAITISVTTIANPEKMRRPATK
jgi:hypothetical protein